MGNHAVDPVLDILILCKDLSLFNLLYNTVYKIKPLSVGCLYCFLVLQINIRLKIRSLLAFSLYSNCCLDRFFQILVTG